MQGSQFVKMKARLKSFSIVASGGLVFFAGINIYKGNDKFYRSFISPIVQCFDPETAHQLAVKLAKYNLVPKSRFKDSPELNTHIAGLKFKNPIGVAAGFDKHCEAAVGLFKAGFGHVEVGTVTPKPQEGNPKPRVFRLAQDEAVINRYGFNSVGQDQFLANFQAIAPNADGIIGISIGKNKTSEDAFQDYKTGIENFGCLGDYIAINISSPNTPGLRKLQNQDSLEKLLKMVMVTRNALECSKKAPVFVKMSPDVSHDELKSISNLCLKYKVDAIIISNTTITRPESLTSEHKTETGGLSGQPIKTLSTEKINEMYIATKGKIPIVGVGGIASGDDAYEKIKAGASLLQLYTSMVYNGPSIADTINQQLLNLLRTDGYSSIKEAVGAFHRPQK